MTSTGPPPVAASDPSPQKFDGWRALLLELCPFRLSLPADEAAAPIARDQLRRWLTVAAWPRSATENLVLAVSEAVDNAVHHAYLGFAGPQPPRVDLWAVTGDLREGRRSVSVVVLDHGRWRAAPVRAGRPGRGIPRMHALAKSVAIEPVTDADGRPAGTRVTLGGTGAASIH